MRWKAVNTCVSLLLFTFFAFGIAQSPSWSGSSADITIAEFLTMQFEIQMGRPDSDNINSFNLISFNPSSDPNTAFVLIIQTWHDEYVSDEDLRREIRSVGDAYYYHFTTITNYSTVRERWIFNGQDSNFVVKHVRYSDLNEALGVTVDGETYFDTETIRQIGVSVSFRGEVWSW